MPSTASTDASRSDTGDRAGGEHGMRQRIVASALTVLREEGAAALTVRNITRLAGCSTTGVYTYFGGKHGVVEAIYIDGFESFDRAVGDGLRRGDLGAAGRAYRRWALDHPTQYMVMFGRAVPDYEPTHPALERSLRSFLALADAVARVAAPNDQARDVHPAARAYHYWATLHGYVMLEIAGMAAPLHDQSHADALFDDMLRRLAGT